MDQYFKLPKSLEVQRSLPSVSDKVAGLPRIQPVVLDTASWNQAMVTQWPDLLTSWNAESPERPPVVSARFKGRRIKTSSYFFSETGPAKSGKRSSLGADLFDPYAPDRAAGPSAEEKEPRFRKKKS
jgi:hypothetical protein